MVTWQEIKAKLFAFNGVLLGARNILTAFVFSLILLTHGINNPQLNWDIIGYTAAVFYKDNIHGEELREKTYNEIKSLVSQKTYMDLTLSSPYRATVAGSPESIEQHMPFYTIRMGYLWTLSTVSNFFSTDIAPTTYWVASFFAGLCVLLLGLIFTLPNFFLWLLIFPLVLHLAGFTEIAALSTPDSMAAFLALTTWYLYQKNRPWLALLPLTLLPLVRTDFIIIAGILGIFSFLNKRQVQAVLYFVLPALMYIYVNKVNANYGYLKIFNFTLIGIDPFPATMHIQTTLLPYLKAYAEGFSAFVGHKHFMLFTFYGLCWFKYIRPQKNSRLNQQVGMVLGFVLLHMLLFPAYYQRFFSWCAAIAGLQLITWIYEIRGAHRIRKSSAVPFSEKTL